MPPVVVGVVAAVAAYAVPTVTLGMALSIGMAAMSVMTILTAKTPNVGDYTSQSERKQVLRSSSASKNVVYGTVVGSGVLFFAEEQPGKQDEKEWLHLCITLAAHKMDSMGTIYLNDETLGEVGGNVTWEFHNDRQTVDPFLLQNCPSWTSTMIGKGIAFLRISLQFNVEKFPSGIPNIKVVKNGRHVYDPRDTQTKFSANAALVYLDYLRTYRKVPDSDIIWDQFKIAANICDEAVAIGDGQYEKRYEIHGEFDLDESPAKILDAMLEACGGQAVYTGGKHGILVGAYNGPAVHDVYSWQAIGDVQITPETSLADLCNTITGTFINKNDGYAESDFPKVTVAEYVAEDGREITDDIQFRFVTSEYQAQRLAMINLQRKRLGRTVTIPMNFSAFAYRPGESVNLHFPELGIDGVEFRITSWDFSIKDAITLICVQDTPELYGDIIGQPIVRPPLTTLPTVGPAMPDNLRYESSPVGDVIQGILAWTNAGTIAYNEVLLKLGSDTIFTAQAPGQICRLGGLAAGNYSAMVRAVALNGAPSSWATIAFTVAVPPVPNSVSVEAGNWNLTLLPKFATSLVFGTMCEFFYYRNDLPINEVEATAQNLGMGTSLTHSGLQPDTVHYYWVRSVNAYGKSAFFAVQGKTTKDVESVLDIISGQIGAEDLIAELRTPLENTLDMWTAKVGNTDLAKYGGIGLTVETDEDGVTRVKCIVDAQVFAILDPSGATGANSRHPFVVKDGVVYMNKLLLDDAEIGSIIAKYINVTNLDAVTITASTIKSSDNGASFSLTPDGTLVARKASITGDITATSGTFTGTIHANAGEMNNIVIAENCNVLGTIYSNKIVGDVFVERAKRIPQTQFSESLNAVKWVTISSIQVSSADSLARNAIVSGLVVGGTVGGNSSGSVRARLLYNGNQVDIVSQSASNSRTTSGMNISTNAALFHTLPAGATGTYTVQVASNASNPWYFADIFSFRLGRSSGSL